MNGPGFRLFPPAPNPVARGNGAPRNDPLDRDCARPRITRAGPIRRSRYGETRGTTPMETCRLRDPDIRARFPKKLGKILSMKRQDLRPKKRKFRRRCVPDSANLRHPVSREIALASSDRVIGIPPWRDGSPRLSPFLAPRGPAGRPRTGSRTASGAAIAFACPSRATRTARYPQGDALA
jgi:hypothetical protein